MAPQTGLHHSTEVIVSGAFALVSAPRAPITPTRWAALPAKLARMDRLCALALVAADGAILDAALDTAGGAECSGERTAVVLGTAYGCHATNEDYYRGLLAQGAGGASPRLFAYTLPSSPVGEISIHYGIRGPATAVAPGLTAGLDALTAGLRELRAGRADRVLVTAAEVASPLLEQLLQNGLTISQNGSTIPLSDGAAALVLERASDAAARGATPRGRILATASAYASGARGAAVEVAAQRALAAADLGPGAIAQVLGSPFDSAAIRPLGIEAPAHDEAPGTLGAAPLLGASRWLCGPAGIALVVAGDPEGNGAAALLSTDAR